MIASKKYLNDFQDHLLTMLSTTISLVEVVQDFLISL